MALPPRTGTGFVNLGKYLQANKGSKVGQGVQSGVQNTVGKFRTGLSTAQQDFQKDVSGAALDTDPNKALRSEVLSKISNLQNQNQIAGVGDQNTPKILGQSDIDKYANFRGGNYTGPQEIAGGARLLGQGQNLESLGKATRTSEGRQGLLQQFVGGNQYTQGQQKLDSLLLGQQAKNLGQINRNVQGLGAQTANQLGMAHDLATLQAGRNRAFGQESQNLVNTQAQGIQNSINDLVNSYRNKQQLDYENAIKNITNREATGVLEPLKGQATFGVDPTRFLSRAPEAQIGTVATPQQQAQYEALSRLSGKPNDFLTSVPTEVYDPNKAVGFNMDQFKAAQQAAVKAFGEDLANMNVSREREVNQRGDIIGPANVNIKDRIAELKNRIAKYGGSGPNIYTKNGGMAQDQQEVAQLEKQLADFIAQRHVQDTFK